ncbi:hypothetical protein PCL1606_45120 [Pseudomonas chlororaphis]|uniref:Uncharacterized protein n=1 Tax=Pseudomonas chlororaphis TaxID=587753 RepID=A0A0D5Y4N0_9PSED|nr:hypothetical protein PCL1606_45120 [Pseudomonas chlororaphis]
MAWQVAGNLVQGFSECKKIIKLILLNFFFRFFLGFFSRKNKKLSHQTEKISRAVNLQSPARRISSGKNTFQLVKKT